MLRYGCSGVDSLFRLFIFFFNWEAGSLFSLAFPNIWNYQLLPLGGSTASSATGLSSWVLNDKAAQNGLPPP